MRFALTAREPLTAVLAGLALTCLPAVLPINPGQTPAGTATLSVLPRAQAQTNPASTAKVLRISAIPDQKPEKLNRLYGLVANELSKQLGVTVKYVPVTDYTAAVSAFRTGDLDLVWFAGAGRSVFAFEGGSVTRDRVLQIIRPNDVCYCFLNGYYLTTMLCSSP